MGALTHGSRVRVCVAPIVGRALAAVHGSVGEVVAVRRNADDQVICLVRFDRPVKNPKSGWAPIKSGWVVATDLSEVA
jgi:hypothetical protein